MKTKELIIESSRGTFAVLVDEDDWEKVNEHTWFLKWDNKKKTDRYYAKTHIPHPDGSWIPRSDRPGQRRRRRKALSMHRLIMNPPKNMQIDHINGNGLDNRKCNLRVCTNAQNNANKPPQKNSKSGLKGVAKSSKNRWVAYIGTNILREGTDKPTMRIIGYFSTKEEAGRAYDAAAKERYGEYAWLNFPEEDK